MKIAIEIVPAHHSIDDGYSRFMYAIVNAILECDGTHEFLIILGPDGNAFLLTPSPRTTIVRCPSHNRNFNQQVTAARLARRWGADALHNFGAPASIFWSKPLILTIHDAAIVTHSSAFPTRWVWYQKLMYGVLKKRNPMVVTVSEFSRGEIAEHMGFAIDRIHVVHPIPFHTPHVATVEERDTARQLFHLPEKYFLYVGMLEPRKNLVRLIHAFERYRARGGDAALVIGGRLGWKSQEIAEAARSSPIAEHIVLPGFLSDAHLPAVYSGAHAFVFPSLYEGFGIPPVEAMMFDVPVLASNAGSLPEILGDAALFVDPLDIASIADGLLRIDTDTHMRTSLMERGKFRRTLYSKKASAQRMLNIYDLL